VKLLAAATVAVLLTGLLIAGGLYVATSGAKTSTCRAMRAGTADQIRGSLEDEGPYLATGGGRCSYWLAIADGNIVAYKVDQRDGCVLTLKHGERWVCSGVERDPATLDQYQVSIQPDGTSDIVVVDLTPTTTSTSS
jgi:hypothetical protein